jgi:hypothetical protein
MKNYLKFIVAVVGITVATLGSIPQAKALTIIGGNSNPCLSGEGTCGYEVNGQPMTGKRNPNYVP